MERILGHERAIDMLRRALAAGRLHHAWIFSGPRGVGKFTTALEFARIVLDPEAAPNLAGELESDPEGRSSQLIRGGIHPDLHVIRKELARHTDNKALKNRKLINIPLDILRQHMIGGTTADGRTRDGPAYRTAQRGHGKMFIVDEAELIDANGQNALLKTLEEPPPHTYLILVTARPERLLPTIFSRCQHLRFGRLDHAAMSAWFAQSGLDLPPDEREWIERFCDGCPGIAVLAAEYGFFSWHRTLAPMLEDLDRGRFPVMLGATMGDLVQAYTEAWTKKDKQASKDAANKDGVRHLLTLLASGALRSLHDSCTRGEDAGRAAARIDLVRDAELQIAANVNMRQVLENLVVQWAALDQPAPARA